MFTKKQIVFILLWSLLGVLLIVLGQSFSNRGFLTTTPPYAFVMITSIVFHKPKTNSFIPFFIYAFSVFMIISVFSIIYIMAFDKNAASGVPFSHWIKVFGYLLGIGIPCAALLAGPTYLIKRYISRSNPQ